MPNGKILVVDDNNMNRDFLARWLNHEGYETSTAASGKIALEQVQGEEIALVLLDLLMPEMGGIEVLQELRKTRNALDLPVMIVSAYSDTPQMVAALDLGANDYITKPIDFQLLLAKIRRHLTMTASFSTTVAGPVTVFNASKTHTGDRLGHYELGKLIGQGGMGRVYQAKDTRLLRDVAIKIMAEGDLPDKALERFLQEARAVARVSHPGVVTIHDVATEPLPYIAMELLHGQVLSSIPHDQMPVKRAIGLTVQVLRALQCVHGAGVIHRDIKPANIMVCEHDRVVVLDFGLAKLTGTDVQLSQSGSLYGTPTFMAPEQLQDNYGEVDGQTDVFGVASLLYLLVCGQPPFNGANLPKLITEILYEEVKPPQEIEPGLSDALAQAIVTGLQKEKQLRFKDCGDFISAIQELDG